MRKIKRISTKARQVAAIAARLEGLSDDEKTAVMLKAVQGLGGSLHVTAMVPCPVCGQNTLPAEYSHGVKQCRSCCYYNQQTFSAERIAETIADSLAWMTAHGKRAVA
ncbi:MAG: hypothetical protein ACYDHX_04005 [Methanothrix sp.]